MAKPRSNACLTNALRHGGRLRSAAGSCRRTLCKSSVELSGKTLTTLAMAVYGKWNAAVSALGLEIVVRTLALRGESSLTWRLRDERPPPRGF
jgi:hypothetical protein